MFHASLLTLQSCAGIAFSSGRQWSRLEVKQSRSFSSIFHLPFFSWIKFLQPTWVHGHECSSRDTTIKSQEQDIGKDGWTGQWPAWADLPPYARPPLWSRECHGKSLSFDLTWKNLQGRNYATSLTEFLEKSSKLYFKELWSYTRSFGFPVSFLQQRINMVAAGFFLKSGNPMATTCL